MESSSTTAILEEKWKNCKKMSERLFGRNVSSAGRDFVLCSTAFKINLQRMKKTINTTNWKRNCVVAGLAAPVIIAGVATADSPETKGNGAGKPRVLASSDVLKAKDAKRSKAFEVDITGLKTVMLKADDVDGNDHDWIDWYDMSFETKDGEKIAITDKDVKAQTQGWGEFAFGKAADGKASQKVEGKEVKGFGGHAPSMITLNVPEGAVKLVATGALDDGGALAADKASVKFSIVNSDLGWMPQESPHNVDVSKFTVPEGLEVTLWAQSPMLYNPTNMDIDAKGRIWVAEGVNYRREAGRRPEGDRIVVLEDTDKDGKADTSHTFVQDPSLECPLGVSVFDNVIMVPQPPHLIKYTDVNRDLKFDPKVDKKEIFLTGFNAAQHDHSLHSVTAGPDGKWYFNNGNCGAIFTDKSGKTFRMNSVYGGGGGKWFVDCKKLKGAASDDGYVWSSGFTVRMDPDGTNVEIVGHGYRNSYEQTVNSLGDIFQNDNDDYSACRNAYVLEYSSAGYFSLDGQSFWRTQQRPGEPVQSAHWRQRDPGTFEMSHVYSPGSPTGVTFYENGALGDKWEGTYLSCDAAQNVIFGFNPKARGAGFELDPMQFVTTNLDEDYIGADGTEKLKNAADAEEKVLFRPSDVCVGPDGALYVTDWYDARVGGHATMDPSCSGAIYRIAPKGFKPEIPEFDLDTVEGQITALESPAVNVRNLGFVRLKAGGEKSLPAVEKLLSHPNKWVAARGVWLLPYLGEKGVEKCVSLLDSDDANTRIVAYRALRRAGQNMLPYAKKLAGDADAAIRRDVAISLRPYSAEETAEIFVTLAKACDVNDKNSVEAIGLGAAKKEDAIWKSLKAALATGGPEIWSDSFAKITWRLWPVSAVADLKARALSEKLSKEQRSLAVESLAFINDRSSADALLDVASVDSSVKDWTFFWLLKRGTGEWSHMGLQKDLKERGIYDPAKITLTPIVVPPATPKDKLIKVEDVMKLQGNKERGAQAIMRCVMCHNINGAGPDYGPGLKGWGATQSRDVIIRSIVDPSADIAHGFKGQEIVLKDGQKIQGLVTSEANPHIITSTGGVTQLVPKNRVKQVKWMKESLMLSADQLGLTAQDVADITAYLQSWK